MYLYLSYQFQQLSLDIFGYLWLSIDISCYLLISLVIFGYLVTSYLHLSSGEKVQFPVYEPCTLYFCNLYRDEKISRGFGGSRDEIKEEQSRTVRGRINAVRKTRKYVKLCVSEQFNVNKICSIEYEVEITC